MLSMLQSSLPANPRQTAAQLLNFGLVLSTAFMLWKGLSVLTDSPSPIVVVLSGSMEPAFQRGDLLFLWNRGFPGEVDEEATAALAMQEAGRLDGKSGAVVADGGESGTGMNVTMAGATGRKVVKKGLWKSLTADRKQRETQVGEIVVYNVRGKDIPIVHRVVRRFGGGTRPLKLLTKGDNNAADDTELYARGQTHLTRATDVIGSVVGYVPYVGYVTILLSEYPWLKTALLLGMGVSVFLARE